MEERGDVGMTGFAVIFMVLTLLVSLGFAVAVIYYISKIYAELKEINSHLVKDTSTGVDTE